MLEEDKERLKKENNEEFFMNTETLPINELLLGDPGIVDYHLHNFSLTPLKLFTKIKEFELKRGVDFKMEYTQIDDKNYSHKYDVKIISKKLGIKIFGYGKTKEEAENKFCLNLFVKFLKINSKHMSNFIDILKIKMKTFQILY